MIWDRNLQNLEAFASLHKINSLTDYGIYVSIIIYRRYDFSSNETSTILNHQRKVIQNIFANENQTFLSKAKSKTWRDQPPMQTKM